MATFQNLTLAEDSPTGMGSVSSLVLPATMLPLVEASDPVSPEAHLTPSVMHSPPFVAS